MTPELFRKLAALGLSTDQIAGVLDIVEADAETRKEKGRQRWRKWKDNQPANVSKRLLTDANVSSQLARGEDSSSKKVISGKEDKEGRAPAAPTPRAELERVLDSEHAVAVVEHRQRIKKPLTAYAAKKLANSLSKAPDANAAADLMVEKGWQSFEVAWLDNRTSPRPHSTASPPAQDFNAILDAIQGKTNAAHTGQTIDGSHERTDRGSAPGPVQLYAVPSGR